MKVAILGCGPAGLMAAHAVAQRGHEPIIFSKKQPSEMFGAMYLHKPILGINSWNPDFMLDVFKSGSAREYAEKVYGNPDHPISFNNYRTGQVPGWSLPETYERLWKLYSGAIEDRVLFFTDITDICDEFALVLSTIPAHFLCSGGYNDGHSFDAQPIWVLHGEDPRERFPSYMMYYQGDPDVPWYRFSMFGTYKSWEYSKDPSDTPIDLGRFQLSRGSKPIKTDCDCPRPNVRRLGRFGKWDKGVLTHHAFEEASTIVREEARALL